MAQGSRCAPLAERLALAAEFKQVLKQDLDLDINVPKFNCLFPGDRINDDDHACALFQNALEANPQLACLSGMDADGAACRRGAHWQ